MQKDLRSRLNEDNTRDRLFHPRMVALGYPSAAHRGPTQYDQQGYLVTGRFDGCYLLDARPMVLVELKRERRLDSASELATARQQIHDYALAEDFEVPPPFLLLSDGHTFEMYERTNLDPSRPQYQPLPVVLPWAEVRDWTPGKYAARFVSLRELVGLFRDYVRKIEEEILPQVVRLVEAGEKGLTQVTVETRTLGRRAIDEVAALFREKVAATTDDGPAGRKRAVAELTAAAALNYVNKVFFLKYCEDRHLQGLFRILAEVETDPVAAPKQAAYAAAYSSLVKRRLLLADAWTEDCEAQYRELVRQLKTGVLDRRSWFELVQAAFLAAEQSFPVIYRPTPYDHLCPQDATIIDMLSQLRTKDFSVLDHEMVGEIYQSILRNEQYRQKVLGSFYTPPKTVAYMVSKLPLDRECTTLEPACGSGHFVEELYRQYLRAWQEDGYAEGEAAPTIIDQQIFAFDIDDFAAQLAAMRIFFLRGEPNGIVPNIFVRDTLDMAVGTSGGQRVMDAEGRTIFDAVASVDPREKLRHAQELDGTKFDRIVGNPPYGGRPTPARLKAYEERYRKAPGVHNHTLGSNDTFGLFVANAIERAAEGGIICLLISDSALSIPTHEKLRRLILDTCKIREIVLAPADLFRPVATSRTCIITLEKANGAGNREARADNVMRLVDRLQSEDEYSSPPASRVQERRQSDYERVPRIPFFVGVHDSIVNLFGWCDKTVGDVTDGGAGLQTGDNYRFNALLIGSREAQEQAARAQQREAKGDPPSKRVYRIIEPSEVVDFAVTPIPEPGDGFPDDAPHYVPFVRGSSRYQYYAEPDRYVDYSAAAVTAYKTSPSAVVRNAQFYFRRGLATNAHNRMLRATLIENSIPAVNTNIFVPTAKYSVEYLLGLLNSRLATYICTKVINMSIGGLSAHLTPEDIRLIPFAEPTREQMCAVEAAVRRIIKAKRADAQAHCEHEQETIDATIYGVYRLPPGGVSAVEAYWQEVLAEQVGTGGAEDEEM